MDFISVAVALAVMAMQFSGNVKKNDGPFINQKGAGIADIYQGKGDCDLSVGLNPQGTVTLFLISLEGKMVAQPKSFSSPAKVWPNFEVPVSGTYRLVAIFQMQVESHLVNVCI